MYKAVGWHSQNEYMAGNSLADVMRKLQKDAHKSIIRTIFYLGLN